MIEQEAGFDAWLISTNKEASSARQTFGRLGKQKQEEGEESEKKKRSRGQADDGEEPEFEEKRVRRHAEGFRQARITRQQEQKGQGLARARSKPAHQVHPRKRAKTKAGEAKTRIKWCTLVNAAANSAFLVAVAKHLFETSTSTGCRSRHAMSSTPPRPPTGSSSKRSYGASSPSPTTTSRRPSSRTCKPTLKWSSLLPPSWSSPLSASRPAFSASPSSLCSLSTSTSARSTRRSSYSPSLLPLSHFHLPVV